MALATSRRNDIELLRVLACAAVILLHALLIFSPEPLYHLKSPVIVPLAGHAAEFLRVTTMPLFFLMAGWSAVISLRKRDPGSFLRERASRIFVPLLTGIVLFCPLIKFIELRGGRDLRPAGFRLVAPLQDGFVQFAGKFFTRVNMTTWSHLWFLAYLLVISIALLPLLRHLARRTPVHRLPPAWAVYAPGGASAALLMAVGGYWPYFPNLYADWGNVAYYAVYFAAGGVLACWPGFETRLRAEYPTLLLLTAAGFVGIIAFGETTIGRLFVGITAWSCAAGLIGLAGHHPPRASPALAYLSRASLPVYVLHHLPLLAIGLLVMPAGLHWAIQMLLIWTSTMLVTLAAYHVLVRPWRIGRGLFGMAEAPPAAAGQRPL